MHMARALPIHGRNHVRHNRESRANMVVGNDPTHYWAYCHACKASGRVNKDHVILGAAPPPDSGLLTIPTDLIQAYSQREVDISVAQFLTSKNMDHSYLPAGVMYSPSRKRLLVPIHPFMYMGRDTTGRAEQKWLTYGKHSYGTTIATHRAPTTLASVVVEDTFSMYKVAYATRDMGITVYTSLGTRFSKPLQWQIVQSGDIPVIVFYDNDKAGIAGTKAEAARLRALGLRVASVLPPESGADPKDCTIRQIQELIGSTLSTL